MIRATYCGFQEGYKHLPGFHLYNLVDEIPGHPACSTVTQATIERYGILVLVAKS